MPREGAVRGSVVKRTVPYAYLRKLKRLWISEIPECQYKLMICNIHVYAQSWTDIEINNNDC